MEMLGRPGGNGAGGAKTVTFEFHDAVSVSGSGRRRNSSLSSFLDMDGGTAARAPPPRPPLPPTAHGMMGSGGRRRTYGDGELDVFSAERYFRGSMDGDDADRKDVAGGGAILTTTPAVQPLVETATAAAAVEAVVMAKPSSTRASTVSFTAASSAASSVNSQTALFRQRRSSSRDSSKCCVRVGVLMRTCSGKRSVRVDDGGAAKEGPDTVDAEPAVAAAIDWYRELRMHKAGVLGLSADGNHSRGMVAAAGHLPPSLNLGTAKVAAIGGREVTGHEKVAAEPPELTFSSTLRRRSNFTTLVAPVIRAANVPAPASGRVAGELNGGGAAGKVGGGGGGVQHEEDDDDDDAGSESSSDLFEIKSLMIDDCAYEPSEASIQWSVVTASVASERGDRGGGGARWVTGGGGNGGGGGGRGPVAGRLHRPAGAGMLAGCASHRAVDVSAAAMMQQRRRSEGAQKARRNAGGA